MTPLISWIYLSAVVILIALIVVRAGHKFLTSILLFWLLGYPVLVQEEIMPHMTTFGFDLQPTRILLIIVFPLLLFHYINSFRQGIKVMAHITLVEYLLVGYVVFSILSILLNYSDLGQRSVISGIEKLLIFGVLYFVARDYLNQRDYLVLIRAIIIFSIFSAIAGLIQFAVSPDFFRVSTYRPAFGDIGRSTGAFSQEYEQGMFLTFAVAIMLLPAKRIGIFQVLYIILMTFAVFVTFQRMPWIVFALVVGGLFYLKVFREPVIRVVGLVVTGLLVVIIFWLPWQDILFSFLPASFIYGRLLNNTLSIRLTLNTFALSLLTKYPLGLGYTSLSPVYNNNYFQAGLPVLSNGTGLVIHNGFLSAAVRFGIGGGLAFIGMLIGFLLSFKRHSYFSNPVSFIPLFLTGIFILYNLTQDFAFPESQVALIFSLLLGYYSRFLFIKSDIAGEMSLSRRQIISDSNKQGAWL